MGKTTNIAWTQSTLNLAWGCTKVSEECRNCYMYRMSPALGRDPHKVQLTRAGAERLLMARAIAQCGERIFVNSMSDTFHKDIPDSRLDEWFAEMSRWPKHQFQVLTKRPERAADYFAYRKVPDNCWLGTSVGIRTAKPRIDILATIDARVRFLSCEPLLEDLGSLDLTRIHWVIVGGESDRSDPRPMKPEWAESIIEQCREQGVKPFFKQMGGVGGDNAGGNLLNGRLVQEYPA